MDYLFKKLKYSPDKRNVYLHSAGDGPELFNLPLSNKYNIEFGKFS